MEDPIVKYKIKLFKERNPFLKWFKTPSKESKSLLLILSIFFILFNVMSSMVHMGILGIPNISVGIDMLILFSIISLSSFLILSISNFLSNNIIKKGGKLKEVKETGSVYSSVLSSLQFGFIICFVYISTIMLFFILWYITSLPTISLILSIIITSLIPSLIIEYDYFITGGSKDLELSKSELREMRMKELLEKK